MKKQILILVLLTSCLVTFAQTEYQSENKEKVREDYDKFIGKVLNLNTNNLQTSFIFDISSSPALQLTLPVYQSVGQQFFIKGNISSTNNYTPLVKKDKWVPDASVSGNWSIFLKKTVKFYVSEFKADALTVQEKINSASINDASQLNFLWFSVNAGYNYSGYNFFSDDIALPLDKRITRQNYNSTFFKANLNWFFYPSKAKARWLSLNGNLGYSYKTNDNNYSDLPQVNVKTTKTFTDAAASVMEVTEDETTARTGKFIITNSSTFEYNLMALISPSENFYVGLSLYGNTRITRDLKSTNLGIGLSVPIQKAKDDKKTIANFTLKYDMPDVSNQLNNLKLKDKGKIGFTIGVPITTFRAK